MDMNKKITITRAKSKKENLCDTCRFVIPECQTDTSTIRYGTAVGNDNVIACSAYRPAKRLKFTLSEDRLPEPTPFFEREPEPYVVILKGVRDWQKAYYLCSNDRTFTWWQIEGFNGSWEVIAWLSLKEFIQDVKEQINGKSES